MRISPIYKHHVLSIGLLLLIGLFSSTLMAQTPSPIYAPTQTAYICPGGCYNWRGNDYCSAGTYQRTSTSLTPGGPDTIHTLDLRNARTYYVQQTDSICRGDAYIWEGHNIDSALTQPGYYWDTLPSIHGCDSVCELRLLVRDRYIRVDSVTITEKETPYYFGGRYLNFSGTYYDTLYNKVSYLCDSLIQLNLTVLRTIITNVNVPFCEGETMYFHEEKITESCVRSDTLRTRIGADSIINYNYQRHNRWEKNEYITICTNHPVPWPGHEKITLKGKGMYLDTFHTVHGCDSIYRIYVTEAKPVIKDTTVTISAYHAADSLPYIWIDKHGVELRLTRDTNILDTIGNSSTGCDSINNLHFRVIRKWRHDTVYYCPGGTVTVDGRIYDADGDHEHWLLTSPKATYYDSIHYVHVTRAPVVQNPTYEVARICSNETPYHWYRQECMTTGIYHDTIGSSFGCDSVVTLHLTVDSAYTIDSTIIVCDGKSFTIGTGDKQKTFTKDGVYIDSKTTGKECDSITTYHIKFYQSQTDSLIAHLRDNPFYEWYGDKISEPGKYTKTIKSKLCGCDSIVHFLHLIKDSAYYTYDTATTCSNQGYHWERNKQWYQNSGNYTAAYKSIYNMDSIFYLNLTVKPVSRTTAYDDFCEGGKIKIGTKEVSTSGVYDEVLPAVNGCDSIISHVVTVHQKYSIKQTVTVPAGSPYTWVGHKGDTILTEPGLYYDNHKTVQCKCDSVYVLNLIHAKTFSSTTVDTVCENDLPYIWRGKEYMQSTEARDQFISSQNVDSSYYLKLTVVPQYKFNLTDSICPGGSIRFFDKTLTEPGQYTHKCLSSFGCDSVFVLNLNYTVMPKISHDTIRGCHGQSIQIRDTVFTTSGQYQYVTQTASGCDSTIHYIVQIEPKYYFPEEKTIYIGNTYKWVGHKGDIVLKKTGIYYDSLTTVNGCDSIYCLHLFVVCEPKAPVLTNIEICSGESFVLGDTIIKTPGTYRRIYVDKNGCDSVVDYAVQVHPSYFFEETATFCKNESYKWEHGHDTILTRAGQYYMRGKTVRGCDSTYTLILRESPAYLFDTTIYVCKEEVPYKYKGIEYRKDTVFYDSLLTKVGNCDSIHITRFVLNDHCSAMELYTRCEGDPMIIDGRRIYADGEYRIPIGADSVHRFNVLSYPTFDYSLNLGSHCDSVTHQGTTYYPVGSNRDTVKVDRYLTTIHGCDSIEHLTMVIYRSAPYQEFTQQIYDYSTVLFGGQIYSKTGDYTRQYRTIHGCDSTVTLHLTVVPTDSTGALHFHHCYTSTASLEVFGKLYRPSKDTIVFDTVPIPNAGMLIIRKAIIRVTYPFTITSVDAASEICSTSEIAFNIALGIDGSLPVSYELDFLPSQLSVSPAHQEGDMAGKSNISVKISGRGLYVSPGEYPYRLKLFAEDCHMSDTIIDSSITVHYPSSILEANWDNTVAILNQEYNEGRWKFIPPYNWKVTNAAGQDKTAVINPNQSLSYLCSNLLEPGDVVTIAPLRSGYDRTVSSCEFIFYPVATDNKVPIFVYPTAARTKAHVTIESTIEGSWALYNSTGHKVSNGTFVDGTQEIPTPNVEGCYILYMQPLNSGKQVKQIIVY